VRFKGQLLLPSERGPGLPVDLEVADHHLAVVSEQDELGAWPLEAIRARRIRGDTFAITVAGEDLHFVPDDTISFAYIGMPAIERFAKPSPTRSPLRALLRLFGHDTSKPHHSPEVTPPPPAATTDESLPSREDESSPHGQIPSEAEPQLHGLKASRHVSDPQPESTSPSSSDGTGSPRSRISAKDELSHRSELKRPTQHPSIETTNPQQEIDTTSEMVPPSERHDTSSDADTIGQLHQDKPPEDEPTASPTETMRCPALRNDGLPCQSTIIAPSGYCYPHDPERALGQGFRQAQEARERLIRKGTARLTRVYARLDKAFRQVERGVLNPEKAMAMAQLARTMCAILELDEEPSVSADEDSPPFSPNRSATRGDNDTGPRTSGHEPPTDGSRRPEG